MLKTRILTAAVGIPVILFVVITGNLIFAAFVTALAVASWIEFANMMRRKHPDISVWIGIGGICLLLGWSFFVGPKSIDVPITAIILVYLARPVVGGNIFSLADVGIELLGILYIGVSFSAFISLRSLQEPFGGAPSSVPAGVIFLGLILAGTWANDTAAYFAGRALGRHKMVPQISPAKTWEGFGAGFVGTIVIVALAGLAFGQPMRITLLIGVLIGLAAPLGDLAESVFKRYAGVKDSGHILPGHGGILDRFDSLMFVAPIIYHFLFASL